MRWSKGLRVCVCGWESVILAFLWRRVQRGHSVVIQLLCRQDTPSLGSVVLLQHPSRHYITLLESTQHPTSACIDTTCTHTRIPRHLYHTDTHTPHQRLHIQNTHDTHNSRIPRKWLYTHHTNDCTHMHKLLQTHQKYYKCTPTTKARRGAYTSIYTHTHTHTTTHTPPANTPTNMSPFPSPSPAVYITSPCLCHCGVRRFCFSCDLCVF